MNLENGQPLSSTTVSPRTDQALGATSGSYVEWSQKGRRQS
jgi:hypothetical protein